MLKTFITSTNLVTFTCPKCEHARTVSIADHQHLESAEKVKIKCVCGHTYRVVIEKRRQYRKSTNFPGTFSVLVDGKETEKGYMTVLDMSRTGVKIKLNDIRQLSPGSILKIEFHLDDANHSFIQKEVVVRKIFDKSFGVEFTSIHPSDPSDKALGFYMLR